MIDQYHDLGGERSSGGAFTSRIYDFSTNCSLLHLFADIFTYPRPSVEKIAGNFTSCHVIAHTCMYLHIINFLKTWRVTHAVAQRIPAYSSLFQRIFFRTHLMNHRVTEKIYSQEQTE